MVNLEGGEYGRQTKLRKEVVEERNLGEWVTEFVFWGAVLYVAVEVARMARYQLTTLPPPPRLHIPPP